MLKSSPGRLLAILAVLTLLGSACRPGGGGLTSEIGGDQTAATEGEGSVTPTDGTPGDPVTDPVPGQIDNGVNVVEGVEPYADGALGDPVTDPVPGQIGNGVTVRTQEIATIPQSVEDPADNNNQLTRLNYGYHAKDGSGRFFVNDLNGIISLIDAENNVSQYLDVATEFDNFRIDGSLNAGLSTFTFHPDFASNGLLYTIHTETAIDNPAAFDFDHPSVNDEETSTRTHSVITEWTASDPTANMFNGDSREVLRVVHAVEKHGIQLIEFNRTAAEGSDDYGVMYVSVGDGEDIAFTSIVSQDLTHPQGKILRLIPDLNDERGTISDNGKYRIPSDNPFASSTDGTLSEIYSYGERNPIRFDFDPANGNMISVTTGEKNLEEVNLTEAGANNGWPHREGTYARYVNDEKFVYEVPEENPNLIDPVAQYDHDEGFAIIGGFIYRGDTVPELTGKYVFGDIVRGGIFYVDADELSLGSQAAISELQLQDEDGQTVTFLELIGSEGRADLRFGLDEEGEILLMSKQDGVVRKILPVS